jgi:hypothetical protein
MMKAARSDFDGLTRDFVANVVAVWAETSALARSHSAGGAAMKDAELVAIGKDRDGRPITLWATNDVKATEVMNSFVNRVQLKPTDVLVIQCDDHLSTEQADYIKAAVKQWLPGCAVLVLGSGFKLTVLGE